MVSYIGESTNDQAKYKLFYYKLYWNKAYKHIAVRPEDHPLKVIQFQGRFFGEVMVTFGFSSSAGMVDDGAKLVKLLAKKRSQTFQSASSWLAPDYFIYNFPYDGSWKFN